MSAKSKDLRPKVISFPTVLDGLNIAAKQSILWPCYAFNISIPQNKKNALNIFEETVLKVTEIESGDTNRIESLSCLEKELVSFIQNRLNQLGLLDNRYELSEDGKKLLESRRNNSEENVEYVVGTIFVDLHSGKLLPYVHIGSLGKEKIVSIDNDFITVEFGSTGKGKQQKCRLIRPSQDSFWKVFPDSNDIIKAIREFKKRYKRHALLNKGINQSPPPVPVAEAISLQDNPELVYLHCKALIQIGNSDILVTDGCGFGFSESFASYLMANSDKNELKWIQKFKEQGVVGTIETDFDEPTTKRKNSWKFPEVTKRIIESENNIQSLNRTPETSNEEKTYIENRQKIVSALYAGLEWSLRYSVYNYPIDEWEQIYKTQNLKDNEKILCNFAKKIGFSVTEKNRTILQVKAGASRQIVMGKVELQPLVAIAITGAATKYSNHPFHFLSKSHFDFLSFIADLKKMRDPIEHGDISDYKADSEQITRIAQKLKSIIMILRPSIGSELKESDGNLIELPDDINQERLKAQVKIEKEICFAFFSNLLPEIKEQLIRCELMLNRFTTDKSQEIINCLSSTMQLSLFDATKSRKLLISQKDPREEAIEKIVQYGFYESSTAIPEQINTVNVNRLRRAIQGESTTLGAHLLSVFLLGSENELIQLRNSYPTFIEFIANLIRLRGHGNNQQDDFSRNDMESVKIEVFKLIKIITEVF